MKSILVELQCPFCGYKTHKKSEQFIVSQFESKFREQILQDTFFHHECPCCHHELSFLHTCLYQDHKHHFLILLENQKQDNTLEFEDDTTMIKRLVRTKEELVEKIHIFEDDFSDVVIECLKIKLRLKLALTQQDNIHYHDYDHVSDTLWFEIHRQETELIAVPKTFYHNIQNKITYKNNGKVFSIVNADTAIELINTR